MSDLTQDAFLGGQLYLWQPRRGYRAGVDPVLLAASVPAQAGQTVLELGCGAGAAMLCLHARVKGLHLTGVEVQRDYATLARRNATEVNANAQVVATDLRDMPLDLRQQQFHHVLMNPPYFDRSAGTAARDPGRDTSIGGDTPLSDWLNIGIKRLAPKGRLSLIQHIARLPDVIAAVHGRLGSLVVLPIHPRPAQPPGLFILQGVLAGRSAFRMAAPLVMHEGAPHDSDRESYTHQTRAILRAAATLDISD